MVAPLAGRDAVEDVQRGLASQQTRGRGRRRPPLLPLPLPLRVRALIRDQGPRGGGGESGRGPVTLEVVVLVIALGASGGRAVALLLVQAALEAVLIVGARALSDGGGAVGAFLALAGEALGVPAAADAVEAAGGGAEFVVSSHVGVGRCQVCVCFFQRWRDGGMAGARG